MAALGRLAWVAAALLLVPFVRCRVEDEAVTLRPPVSHIELQLSSSMCRICDIFVDIVEYVIRDERLENWLVKLVQHHVCPHLPKRYQEECVEEAPTVIPMVINWIEDIVGTALCIEAGVCGPAALDIAAVDMDQKEDFDCTVCQRFASIVESGDMPADTLTSRIGQLKQACAKLNGEDPQDHCRELVDKYGYMLVYFIARGEGDNPSRPCSDLAVCPNAFKTPVIDPLREGLVRRMLGYGEASNAEGECQQCKDVAQSALADFMTADARDEVVAYVTEPCSWIPQYAAECQPAVGNYSTEVINAIVSATRAEDVCNYLQHCADGKGIARRTGDESVTHTIVN